MKVITNSMIVKINNLYENGKNCKAIAHLMNISPYTVKKYIKDYEEDITEKTIYNKTLPNFNTEIFREKDWGELCVLSETETEEIENLWEEMEF